MTNKFFFLFLSQVCLFVDGKRSSNVKCLDCEDCGTKNTVLKCQGKGCDVIYVGKALGNFFWDVPGQEEPWKFIDSEVWCPRCKVPRALLKQQDWYEWDGGELEEDESDE